MEEKVTINFNNNDYVAKFNENTGYYEVEVEAPEKGGIYASSITYVTKNGEEYIDSINIQILTKQQIKLETNKTFMWIFDYKDFSVKDIVEIANYEINIDEETNANTIINVLKKTTAKARDIVAIKKDNQVIYWGIIDNIQNEDGEVLYEYTLKYITNLFNQEVILPKKPFPRIKLPTMVSASKP